MDLKMMGRAEKRMAKKRAGKKSGQHAGGRPGAMAPPADKVSKTEVTKRLGEVPVFGLRGLGMDAPSTETGWLVGEDGTAIFYMDAREAQRACAALADSKARVEGVPLDTVYWESTATLKASDAGMRALETIPAERKLVPDVRTPLFCIDGMQTTDKTTGISSLPMFFSKMELLEFANPVYGSAEAKDMVLVTDLEVVVVNMLRGPAGPLRDAKFFAEASALTAMDKQEEDAQQSVFPTMPDSPEATLFPGMPKMPWQ